MVEASLLTLCISLPSRFPDLEKVWKIEVKSGKNGKKKSPATVLSFIFSGDPEGDLWHSTAIVSRLSSRCVETKSGSQYKLVGPINEDVTLQQGTCCLKFVFIFVFVFI